MIGGGNTPSSVAQALPSDLPRALYRDSSALVKLVRRTQEAAERFLRRVLDGEDARLRVVVTDWWARTRQPAPRPLSSACSRACQGVEHRRHKGLTNRAEHSHRPVRQRERVLGCASGSRHPRTCSAFWSLFVPSRTTSTPAATSSPPTSTTRSALKASSSGVRLRGAPAA